MKNYQVLTPTSCLNSWSSAPILSSSSSSSSPFFLVDCFWVQLAYISLFLFSAAKASAMQPPSRNSSSFPAQKHEESHKTVFRSFGSRHLQCQPGEIVKFYHLLYMNDVASMTNTIREFAFVYQV